MTATRENTDRTFVEELKAAVTTRAALLVVGVLLLQLAFILSYVGSFHRPKPDHVSIAVVAPKQASEQVVSKLGKLPGDPLDPRAVSSEAEAVRKIKHRDVDAARVAGGAGSSLAQAVEQVVTRAEKADQRSVRTEDIVPAAADDSRGLSSFYLVIGWCVGGYLCAAVLAISAGARPANGSRAAIRLGALALYSIAAGLGGTIIVGPALGALPGSVLGLWGLGTLVVFAVGATTLACQGLAGIVGIGLAILIIVVLGNPSAGGAYPYPLLPDFWQAIGPALPPGAGTWTARSIAYFQGNAITGPLLVLAAWAVAGTVITLVLAMRRKDAVARHAERTEPAPMR